MGSEQRQVVLSTDTTRVLLVDTHTGTGKGAPDCGCKLQAPTAEGVVTVVSALRTLGGWGAGRCGGMTPGSSTAASCQQWAAGAGGARAVGALPEAGPGARGRGRSWESLQGPRGPARGAQT